MNHSPYIIAGMHRSGTSLLAHILCELEFDLGDNLVSADEGNPDGYFEDKFAVSINRSILQASVPSTSEGWPDWGWSMKNHQAGLKEKCRLFKKQAENYLQCRASSQLNYVRSWGWKDPRNTLLLSFWRSIAPQARVIAAYRAPWDVSSALKRVRPPVFLANPGWCLPVWLHYNEHLVWFSQRYPDRCMLLDANTLASNPEILPELLEQKWGLSCPRKPLRHIIRPECLPALGETHPLIKLHQEVFPESLSLYHALQSQSSLPSEKTFRREIRLQLNRQPQEPSLAIIIPTYNQGDLLLEAIASAEEHVGKANGAQVELVIVDDGSTDARSQSILRRLKGIGYRLIYQDNQGLSAARNTGLKHTSAPIVLPLDDDNLLLDGYFRWGLEIMLNNPELAVVYGDRQDFGLVHQSFRPGPRGLREMRAMNRVDACALIRRSCIEACGGYDESLAAMEDWDLWLGMLTRGETMRYLPKPCLAYRHRPNSMIRRHLNSPLQFREITEKIQRKHCLDV